MKRQILGTAIVLLNVALVWWIWGWEDAPEDVPQEMMMTPAQLAATPDFALVHITFVELRLKFQANPGLMPRWRDLPEAARQVLVLSEIEERYNGFSALFRRQESGSFHFQIDDFAKAYEAIGATAVANLVVEAGKLSLEHANAEQPQLFSDIEARFADQRSKSHVSKLLRAYIRSHVDDIAGARFSSVQPR